MSWIKLDDTFADDPNLLALPRGVRLVHVEALVWCCRQLTDGAVPRHALRKVTDEDDIAAAAVQLVEAGLWDATDTGWQIVGFLDLQPSRCEVDEAKAGARFRAARSRRHLNGDHAICTRGHYCPDGACATTADARAAYVPSHVRPLDIDVDVDRLKGSRSRRGGAQAASADAAAAAPRRTRRRSFSVVLPSDDDEAA
jgi:hypothetical protein